MIKITVNTFFGWKFLCLWKDMAYQSD